MTIKKMRAKRHKGTVKRVRVTNGGDLSKGKVKIGRRNAAHRLIKKSGEKKLRARKTTVVANSVARKLKKMI